MEQLFCTRWATLAILAVCFATACSGTEQHKTGEAFRGRWVHAPYDGGFFACGSAETWDLRPARDSAAWFHLEQRLRRLDTSFFIVGLNGPYYLELIGDTSGVGHYGHLGVLPRQLSADTIIQLRFASPSDCAVGGPSTPSIQTRTPVPDSAAAVQVAIAHLKEWEGVRRPITVDMVHWGYMQLDDSLPARFVATGRYSVWLETSDPLHGRLTYVVDLDSTGRAVLVSRHTPTMRQ